MKKFKVWFAVSMEVDTLDDKDAEWVDENVLTDLHDELVKQGYIVDDMGVCSPTYAVDELYAKYKFINIKMRWLADEGQTDEIERLCVIAPDFSGVSDTLLEEVNVRLVEHNDYIFYYFDHDESIVGKHLDFEVLSYEECK